MSSGKSGQTLNSKKKKEKRKKKRKWKFFARSRHD
jgi:hypothetical protein